MINNKKTENNYLIEAEIECDKEAIYIGKLAQKENLTSLANRIFLTYSQFQQTTRVIDLFVEEVLMEMSSEGGNIPLESLEDFLWFCNKRH